MGRLEPPDFPFLLIDQRKVTPVRQPAPSTFTFIDMTPLSLRAVVAQSNERLAYSPGSSYER